MKAKILIIGLPLFIVQLVIVYFITANILISQGKTSVKENKTEAVSEKNDNQSEETKKSENENKDKKANDKSASNSVGNYLFTLDDVICNPAESNGKILVLTSLGFDMNDEQSKKIMEQKNVILKDIVISNISRKTVVELSNAVKRDSLKVQIINSIESKIPDVKIKDLYFSKFIIQ
jgi:flagellar FliL protein